MRLVVPDYKQQGLFARYTYERTDGKPLDDGEQLYSLRYDKDDPWGHACRTTLREFADRIDAIGYKPLAQDLRDRLDAVEARLQQARSRPLQSLPEI